MTSNPANPRQHRRTHKLRIPLAITAAVAASATGFALLAGATPTPAAPVGPDLLQHEFAAAADEFHVPQSVLLALSYQQTRWESHNGQPSTTGNYNVMGLTQVDLAALAKAAASGPGPEADARGDGVPVKTKPASVPPKDSPSLHTLDKAAKLIGQGADRLKADPQQSIRGGAALLAKYQKDAGKPLSGNPADWYDAVAKFTESSADQGGNAFADRVFDTIRIGAKRATTDGQIVVLQADPGVGAGKHNAQAPRASADGQGGLPALTPAPAGATKPGGKSPKSPAPSHTTTASRSLFGGRAALTPTAGVAPELASTATPECPTGLGCDVQPAAYALTNPSDQTSFGNYAVGNRPTPGNPQPNDDGDTIQYIVIHDTESTFDSAVNAFKDPNNQASAHYIVRSSDGWVSQLVADKDVAWHAGNKYVNMHSIGVEHEGFAFQFKTDGSTWYSEQLYQSSATLVRYLAQKYNVPLDRQHIIGHDDVPGPLQQYIAGMHWDPGTFWDWNHYMDLLGAPDRANTGGPIMVGGKVTIAPAFDNTNTPTVTNAGASVTRPENFVYLYTAPGGSTLINGAGTDAADVRDKAVAGTSYIVADQQGDWTAIWYDGQKAWFYNPNGRSAAADNRPGQTVLTPKAGASTIPVYGRAYPELSAYQPYPGINTSGLSPDPYTSITIPAGQAYLAGSSQPVQSEFYYTQNINGDAPNDRTLVVGNDTYYPIRYNHRLAYLKSTDVDVTTAVTPPATGYTPAGPARLLDTRYGIGAPAAKVGGGQSLPLQIAGASLGNGQTIPSGVTAVVLNVTATDPTDYTHVDVYPDGQPHPNASNLNVVPGQTVPNLVVVPVVNGKVDLFNNSGTVNLIADVMGYYSPQSASKLTTAGPSRLLDTRYGIGAPAAKVGGGQSLPLQIAGASLGNGQTIPSGVTAVVLNVTATNPTDYTHVDVYPDGQAHPNASNLNVVPNQTVPNLVVVPVVNGKVDLYNNSGTIDLIADISGYYTATGGSSFVSAGPSRLLDTRYGIGAPAATVGAGQSLPLQVLGRAGVPTSGVTAVVLNVTATGPTDYSHIDVYPDGQAHPNASNLNVVPGQTVPNLVVVPVVNGKVDLYNNSGTVNLIADLAGYYTG